MRPGGLLLPSPAQLQQQNPENLSHQRAFGRRQAILLTGVALSLVLQDPFSLSKWMLDHLIEKGGTWWHWGRFALTLELDEVHAYLQALALQLYPLLHQAGLGFQGYGMVWCYLVPFTFLPLSPCFIMYGNINKFGKLDIYIQEWQGAPTSPRFLSGMDSTSRQPSRSLVK